MKKSGMLYVIKSLIMVVFSLSFALCNGQETKSKLEKHTRSNTIKSIKDNDNLFFIDGQLCQHLRKIFQDSKGNLWFGTNVYGLMKYDGNSLEYITKEDGFSGGRVTAIVEDSIGNIWIATGNGLNKFDGKSFTVFTEEDGLSDSEIWSLILDSKGIFWIGHSLGLSSFNGKEFRNISIPKPIVDSNTTIYAPNRIVGIVEDKDGSLWLGTDGFGICKYDGISFTNFTTKDGLADNAIHEIMLDSKGLLWIGTYWGGLSMFDGKKFTNFTKNGEISGVEVSAFFEDSNGDIWFGVENNGIYKFDGSVFKHYDQESFSNGSILSIYRDRENRFWFGGWGGLFRYDNDNFTPITEDGPWE